MKKKKIYIGTGKHKIKFTDKRKLYKKKIKNTIITKFSIKLIISRKK